MRNRPLPVGFSVETAEVLSHVALHNGWSVLSDFDRKERKMYKSDFWTNYADAMELSIQGNQLIAREIAELARRLWHRAVRSFDGLIHSGGQHRHLPPV
jgi:hypothetical protein